MTDRSTVNVQIGPQTRLTLGSGANSVIGSQLNFPQSPHVPRQVIVTPISAAHTVTHTPSPPLISKVLIKVVKRDGKKAEGKTFTLRNLDPTKIKTRDNLKTLIRAQLQGDIRSGDFDVGYLQNSSVVSLRSREDIQEVMSNAAKGTKVTLWCDGLQSVSAVGNKAKKRKQQDDASSDESDSEPRKKSKVEEKDDKIQKIIQDLHAKFDKAYTPMQYRIWSEMVVGGVHTSLDTAPTNPLFLRAGGAYPKKSPSATEALTKAVVDIASALTPRSVPTTTSQAHVVNSPAKVIDGRSKCYRQLSDLKNLMESGLLSNEEYQREREAIMNTLKKLSC